VYRYHKLQLIIDLDSEHELKINLKHWRVSAVYPWIQEANKEDLAMLRNFIQARAKYGIPDHLRQHFFELARDSPILLELVCYPFAEQRKAGM
jgi:hypothetical protein